MIFFKTVRWKNILSYGDRFTEIQLDRSPSTLITGDNGTGKSTILEAICFGLFGKPFRRIKKGDIVNSKNARGALVEIEFEHRLADRTDYYHIRRGVKPDVFEIIKNGEIQNQHAATKDYQAWFQSQVLKCDYNVFTQIVLVGEATHVSFMRMRTNERRAFVETVLNLNVFSMMNKIHSTHLSALKERTQQLKLDYSLKEQALEFQKSRILDLERADRRSAEVESQRVMHEIVSLEDEVEGFKQTIEELTREMKPLDEAKMAKSATKLKSIKAMLSKASFKISSLESDIKRMEETHVCHACHQDLPIDQKHQQIETARNELEKLKGMVRDLEGKETELEVALAVDEKVAEGNNEIKREIASLNSLIRDRQNRIDRLKNETARGGVSHSAEIKEAQAVVELLENEFSALRKEREEVAEETEYHNLIKTMLQDTGIKASMIKRFIPIINQTINHNLAKLGFFGRFTLDENFEETILARGFDTLSYNSYSEGEKLRIDLAVLLAWRDMARMQGILSTNLLMFDEVIDASMDASGTEAFTTLLGALTDVNVFIISHSPEKIIDKVRSQISFSKEKSGFSKLKEAKGA